MSDFQFTHARYKIPELEFPSEEACDQWLEEVAYFEAEWMNSSPFDSRYRRQLADWIYNVALELGATIPGPDREPTEQQFIPVSRPEVFTDRKQQQPSGATKQAQATAQQVEKLQKERAEALGGLIGK